MKQPKPAMAEPSIRTDGTRLFRLINFELFAVSCMSACIIRLRREASNACEVACCQCRGSIA